MTDKNIRIPIETYNELKRKQKAMSEAFYQQTGKKKRLPLGKVVHIVAKTPVFVEHKKLKKVFGRRKL